MFILAAGQQAVEKVKETVKKLIGTDFIALMLQGAESAEYTFLQHAKDLSHMSITSISENSSRLRF